MLLHYLSASSGWKWLIESSLNHLWGKIWVCTRLSALSHSVSLILHSSQEHVYLIHESLSVKTLPTWYSMNDLQNSIPAGWGYSPFSFLRASLGALSIPPYWTRWTSSWPHVCDFCAAVNALSHSCLHIYAVFFCCSASQRFIPLNKVTSLQRNFFVTNVCKLNPCL